MITEELRKRIIEYINKRNKDILYSDESRFTDTIWEIANDGTYDVLGHYTIDDFVKKYIDELKDNQQLYKEIFAATFE